MDKEFNRSAKHYIMEVLMPNQDLQECFEPALELPDAMTDKLLKHYDVESVDALLNLTRIPKEDMGMVFLKDEIREFVRDMEDYLLNVVETSIIIKEAYRIGFYVTKAIVDCLINLVNVDSVTNMIRDDDESFHFDLKMAMCMVQSLSTDPFDLSLNTLYVRKNAMLEYSLDRIVTDIVSEYVPQTNMRKLLREHVTNIRMTLESHGFNNGFFVGSDYKDYMVTKSISRPLFFVLDGKYNFLIKDLINGNN